MDPELKQALRRLAEGRHPEFDWPISANRVTRVSYVGIRGRKRPVEARVVHPPRIGEHIRWMTFDKKNPAQPPYFNWRSSQALLLYSLALLNAGLLGLGLYVPLDKSGDKWWSVGIGAGALLIVQLGLAIAYLKSREGKSASQAVFGQE